MVPPPTCRVNHIPGHAKPPCQPLRSVACPPLQLPRPRAAPACPAAGPAGFLSRRRAPPVPGLPGPPLSPPPRPFHSLQTGVGLIVTVSGDLRAPRAGQTLGPCSSVFQAPFTCRACGSRTSHFLSNPSAHVRVLRRALACSVRERGQSTRSCSLHPPGPGGAPAPSGDAISVWRVRCPGRPLSPPDCGVLGTCHVSFLLTSLPVTCTTLRI